MPQTAEELLGAKESFDFLKGAKRVRVKIAMQKHTQSCLQQIREEVEGLMPDGHLSKKIGDDRHKHYTRRQTVNEVLNLIDNAIEEEDE